MLREKLFRLYQRFLVVSFSMSVRYSFYESICIERYKKNLKFWQCHYKTEIRYFCLGKSLIVIKNTSKNISRCHVMTFVLFNHFKVGCVSTTDVKLLKLQTNKSISGERNSMMTSLSNQVIILMWFSECSYSFKLHHKIMK